MNQSPKSLSSVFRTNKNSKKSSRRRRKSTRRLSMMESLENRQMMTVFVDVLDGELDDTACGGFSNPCNTIQKAVDLAPAGGEIYVSGGIYSENVTITKDIFIRGEAGLVLVDPPAGLDGFNINGPVVGSPISVKLEDIAVSGAVLGIQGGRLDTLELEDVSTTDNTGDGLAVDDVTRVVIDGGIYSDNGDYGAIITSVLADVHVTGGARFESNVSSGLRVGTADNVTIEGGSFDDNLDSGAILTDISTNIEVERYDGVGASFDDNSDFGLRISDSSSVELVNALASRNGLDGFSMSLVGDVTTQNVFSSSNDAGLHIHGAASYFDTDGTYLSNLNHGVSLVDISGDATLVKTFSVDNDADADGTGDGVRATLEDALVGVGGDFTVLGGNFSDTDPFDGEIQQKGIYADKVAGTVSLKPAYGPLEEIAAIGNAKEGAHVLITPKLEMEGGSYSLNGLHGIFLEAVVSSELDHVTASVNSINGLEARLGTSIEIEDGEFNANAVSGMSVAAYDSLTATSVTANDNSDNGLVSGDTDSVNVNGGEYHLNGLEGIMVIEADDVVLKDGVSTFRNGTGVRVLSTSTFSDTGGIHNRNLDHGILLIDISGSVLLDNVTAEDNDANDNNLGDGFRAITTGTTAIGGSLTVIDSTFQDTDGRDPGAHQENGVFVHSVSGPVTFTDTDSIGNDVDGVDIADGGTSAMFSGGSYSTNNDEGIRIRSLSRSVSISDVTTNDNRTEGIELDLVGNVTLERVTSNLNRLDGLNVSEALDVTISDSEFSHNSDDGIELFMVADIDVSSTIANDNGEPLLPPAYGLRATDSDSITTADLTLVDNQVGGALVTGTPSFEYTASTGNTADTVAVDSTTLSHTRGAAVQDDITYADVTELTINSGDSDDTLSVAFGGLPATINVAGGEQAVADSLTATATAAAESITLTATTITSGSTTINYVEIQDLTIDAAAGDDTIVVDGSHTTILGGTGDDTFVVNETGNSELILDGQGGSDTYTVNLGEAVGDNLGDDVTIADSGVGVNDSDEVTINGGSGADAFWVDPLRTIRGGSDIVNYDRNLESLQVNGLAGDDSFTVIPSDDTSIDIDGRSPAAPALPGDQLNVQALGLEAEDDGSEVQVAGRRAVAYVEIEGVEIEDAAGDAVSPTIVEVGINSAQFDPVDLPAGAQPTSWEQQRSSLRSLQVEFSEGVSVSPADLTLTNLGLNAPVDPDTVVSLDASQLSIAGNVLTISFAAGDLEDGVYELIVHSTVADAAGNSLDGDANATGGDEFVFAANSTNNFHQLEANWNGDTGVSVFDFTSFSYWFGLSTEVAPEYVDLSGDSGVSVFDFTGFANNFGKGVVYPVAIAAREIAAQLGDDLAAAEVDAEAQDAALLELLNDWAV
jgi:hypothetical protein